MLLNNEWVKNEIREEISVWKQMKWTHNNPKLIVHSKGSSEMEIHRDTGLPKKDRNIQINKLTDIYKNWSNNNKVQRE